MVLGDIVGDAMQLFAPYKDAISGLGLTMYHTIGNHDFDLKYAALSNSQNPDEWGEYAFGDALSDQQTTLSMRESTYHFHERHRLSWAEEIRRELTPAQLEWLKKDISYVQPGSLVLLNVHAPVANRSHKGAGNAVMPPNF